MLYGKARHRVRKAGACVYVYYIRCVWYVVWCGVVGVVWYVVWCVCGVV